MKLIHVRVLIAAAALASAILVVGPKWSAQAASTEGKAPAPSRVSDKDLKAFAKAYVEYHKIKQTYEPKLRATKDDKAKAKVEKEGNEKVRRVLEKQGLTPQKYNQLFAAVNRDPQLREKALDLIEAERQRS
jgi:hypothetical protein